MSDEPRTSGSRVVGGKGKPTPKRSAAQRRRMGPVAPPPTTRREAAKRLRAQEAERRREVREGTRAGDPARMMARDAGPVRAFVRDVVDRRRNLAVLLLPVALLLVVAQLAGSPTLLAVAARLWTITLFAVLLDLIFIGVMLRRVLRDTFPEERSLRGHLGYGLLRSTVFRRFRMPPPRVRPTGLRRR